MYIEKGVPLHDKLAQTGSKGTALPIPEPGTRSG
jgi:hypothetical protein